MTCQYLHLETKKTIMRVQQGEHVSVSLAECLQVTLKLQMEELRDRT